MASFSSDDSLDNLISRPDFDTLLQNNATDNLTTENVTFDLGLDLESDAEPIAKMWCKLPSFQSQLKLSKIKKIHLDLQI